MASRDFSTFFNQKDVSDKEITVCYWDGSAEHQSNYSVSKIILAQEAPLLLEVSDVLVKAHSAALAFEKLLRIMYSGSIPAEVTGATAEVSK